jgi:hypothetical protein
MFNRPSSFPSKQSKLGKVVLSNIRIWNICLITPLKIMILHPPLIQYRSNGPALLLRRTMSQQQYSTLHSYFRSANVSAIANSIQLLRYIAFLDRWTRLSFLEHGMTTTLRVGVVAILFLMIAITLLETTSTSLLGGDARRLSQHMP